MKWVNVFFIIAVIAVNTLANALPINGMNTGEISALYPNLFVPAGITFSIWSVIYLGLIGFTLFPFISGKHVEPSLNRKFLLTCFLNVSWIFAWHYLLVELSLFIMLAFLITLYRIYLTLRPQDRLFNWLVYIPLNLYFAWICVATIANFTAVFVHWNIELPYPIIATIILIMVTQLLVWLVNSNRPEPSFSAVIIWALSGIIIKRFSSSPFYLEIIIAASLGIFFTLSYTIIAYRNQSIRSNPV
ncbi:MAG: tryptophan-rich sensory protein [Bacteroidota bacterium]